MVTEFQIDVEENFQTVFSGEFSESLELGRQRTGEDPPYSLNRNDSGWRLVIAEHTETTVGRRQVLLDPQVGDRIKLTNCSSHAAIAIDGSDGLAPESSRIVSMPVTFLCGQKRIFVDQVHDDDTGLNSLSSPKFLPGASPSSLEEFDDDDEGLGLSADHTMSPIEMLEKGVFEPLIRSLEFAIDVLQSAKTPSEFYSRAAQATVNVVGLDTGRVMMYNRSGGWKTESIQLSRRMDLNSTMVASEHILKEVLRHKRVFWQDGPSKIDADSLAGVQAIVAAPILDEHGEVIGALYGDKRTSTVRRSGHDISKLDAMLVELLACGVASGLSRLRQQEAAASMKVQFAQFFTPQLAEQLERDPDLLNGRDAETTVLFCDIRNFSRITESLGTTKTFEWINDVMSSLSECVIENDGVLVDHIGDEIMAMWGAPVKTEDHAKLACRAGLGMIRRLPELNRRWQSTINEPIDVGIGINSGTVSAGNTGSRQKYKYGPLGHNVNLASRVQGVNKYLRTQMIVTGSTYDLLAKEFWTRRLCSVRVVNIQQPVGLYEVVDNTRPELESLLDKYEEGLTHFEAKRFRKAAGILGGLLNEFRDDGPSLILLSRTVNAMVEGEENFDPVWELPGK